jgi:hypothetical protein
VAGAALLGLLARDARAECHGPTDCDPGLTCEQGKCVPVPPTPAGPATPIDTVFLTDGGRVRGQVMEEHPKTGVRVRLADGTVRDIPAAEVDHVEYGGSASAPPVAPPPVGPAPKPEVPPATPRPSAEPMPRAPTPPRAPSPRTAGLRVSSGEPGRLLLDGKPVGAVGSEPLELGQLPPGDHELTLELEDGDSSVAAVTLEDGTTVEVELEPPGPRYAFHYRDGLSFGIGVGAFYLLRPRRVQGVLPIEAAFGTQIHGGGGFVEGIMSYAVSPAVDLRLAPRLALGSVPLERTFSGTWTDVSDPTPSSDPGAPQQDAFVFVPSALVALRINVTDIYSLMVGFRAGAEIYSASASDETGDALDGKLHYNGTLTPRAKALPHLGPELSFLSFRLGAKRQLELECWQGLLIDSVPAFQLGLSGRHSFF